MKPNGDPTDVCPSDETGKSKGWFWATLLFAAVAVAVVLYVLLLQARGKIGESASVTAPSSKSFATPESAIRHFVDGLVAQDMVAAFEACAIREPAEGFDFIAHAEWLGAISMQSEAPTSFPLNREFNRISRAGRLADQTRALTLSLCMNDERFDPLVQGEIIRWGSAEESLGEEFLKATDPRALQELKIVRIDIPMESQQTSPRGQKIASQQSAIYGADAMTERAVLYDLGGRLRVGGFILIRYGEDWRIFHLGSNYARLPTSGAAETTTAEEYQSLLDE